MPPKNLHILAAIAVFAVSAQAQNVTGTILIKKKLTRQSVTPSIPVYQRSSAVKLGNDTETDFIPIDVETPSETPVNSAGTGGR